MKPKQVKLMAIVGGSALITVGVVGGTMNQESQIVTFVSAIWLVVYLRASRIQALADRDRQLLSSKRLRS